jgi:tRNA (guanine-N7-)-methyltransferase
MPQSAHGPLRSFGRIKSRPIKPRQEALLASLLPEIAAPDPAAGRFDPLSLMPGATSAVLEIGFGGGEHMVAQAKKTPEAVVIGAEPFLNGVASALRHVEEQGAANVRIHHGDARELMAALPDASVARAFILFPDPWPKARHHKRRLIQPETVAELARVLTPGARLRFASDWADYVDWTLERFVASPKFRWLADGADDWRTPPADHVTTRYEQKKLGDCAPVFLEFERV